jgi:hypothetical protein
LRAAQFRIDKSPVTLAVNLIGELFFVTAGALEQQVVGVEVPVGA